MREQLIRYVDLLFAGASNASDIKQEILQNTLDRYDDLIAQGKTPEAAYSLSISGIGDISEILGSTAQQSITEVHTGHEPPEEIKERRIRRAAAIAMYILCPVPLFILSEFGHDTIGLCLTLLLVAAATALIMLSGKSKSEKHEPSATYSEPQPQSSPRKELRESVNSVIWAVGLCAYFALSFLTQAWHITWIIFLMIGPAQNLVTACLDFKEASDHEN